MKPGSSTAYEAYIATKDKANITGTQIYRNEYAVGSLYKSANGFEWERDPYSDLTFTKPFYTLSLFIGLEAIYSVMCPF